MPATDNIESRAAVAGHPIHPMLIHFPVAALIALVGADFGFWWTGDEFWARAGLWLAGVGAAGGWVASIAGLIDITTVADIRRRITAWCHAILAVMMLSLASLNWMVRYQGGEELVLWSFYLTGVTAVLISLASYLGGRLVYEHAVGVDVES
ncbi:MULTISPECIES: DUF2231 domain-containing protein [Pseudomonas]|uniref:DUF2231 domain-containing protein n=1 Tax=Pseudomonas luteola TaxID=47886 RepID=A0A2X2DY91_PSELU|nr:MULTISPECIES: DUF2231 domain-containing protein [Pseudomonas]ENA29356.1 hypothetical protein HMPREF1487_08349 [Pseudomonas sp. HPB0071]MBA1246115.1 DUF2231 domain-containing protein [Pseudomonas zeshuii]MBF8642790.1 DUF2231 domain-containing protein [Pseudomonas zeshuii]QEU26829.1 DUF2231 domain-containing protein [Pseudomonas luteola]SHJ39215.1 Uncharacterized membrane protein [Pseudomonas zeshuii]